jgi:Sulfotransferase domain
MALSVIGAGFGRTGTLSMKMALEQLGLGRCYHMVEVFDHPEHVALWRAAADGEPIDWDGLFAGYGAVVDWPACYFWRQLMEHFRDAKVLLTVRDPERWYQSAHDTIYQAMIRPLPVDDPLALAQREMAAKIVLEDTFGGRFEDRAHAIAVYEHHNAEVRRIVPPERLLVYELGQGWEPLCRFVERPVPAEPFPKVNTSEEFRTAFGMSES